MQVVQSPEELYRNVKSIRRRGGPYDPTSIVNNKNWESLVMKWKWDGRNTARNSSTAKSNTQTPYHQSHPEKTKSSIFQSGLDWAVKTYVPVSLTKQAELAG